MKRYYIQFFIFLVGISFATCTANSQNNSEVSDTPKHLQLHVNHSLNNAHFETEQRIINYWQDYLKSGEYFTRDTMWSSDFARIPSVFLFEVGLSSLAQRTTDLHNTIIGVIPVENDYWMLKSMFYSMDTTQTAIRLNHIVSVYFKEEGNGSLIMQNSTDYHRTLWDSGQVGSIRYFLHPDFTYDPADAQRMNEFNDSLAILYDREPKEFDYFVSRYTREIAQVLGYDFNPNIYRPEQTGGMADVYNNVIYAGNNSAYYPHEVVHLYNYDISRQQCHQIIDEGIATFFGGSSGFDLDWHVAVLKEYMMQDDTFDFSEISALAADVPIGESVTDFRYVVGGLLAREIYQKEGIKGLKEALTTGRTDEDFFGLIADKFKVDKENFSDFIRELALR